MKKLLLSLILSLILIGCSTNSTQTKYISNYDKAYIAVKCEVNELSKKPKINLYDVYDTLDKVLIYAESLQKIVNECVIIKNQNKDINNTGGE